MPEYQPEKGLKVYRYPSRGMASQLVGFSNSWLLKDLSPAKMVSSIAGCFVPVMNCPVSPKLGSYQAWICMDGLAGFDHQKMA